MSFAVKLSTDDGLTRRVPFSNQHPSWVDLAAKIETFFSIHSPGVSYTDSEGDVITLSSQEELDEYYSSLHADDPVKFVVVDLSTSRRRNRSLPDSPTSRDTFGGPNVLYEVDRDWQIPIGETFGRFDSEDSLHAYVETVDSTSNLSRSREEEERTASFRLQELTGDQNSRAHISTVSNSSTTSVINSDSPKKPPVHIPIHGLHSMTSGTFGPVPSVLTPSHDFAPLSSSTPRGGNLNMNIDTETPPMARAPLAADALPAFTEAPDPPSPEIHPEDVPTSSSLTNDIATLFNSLSIIFQSHPQLTETVRTILRNLQSGTYWSGHRESVARAAEDVRRASIHAQNQFGATAQDFRRTIEEESRRRIADAFANLLRSFVDVRDQEVNATAGALPSHASPATPFISAEHSSHAPPPTGDSLGSVHSPLLIPRSPSQATPTIPPWSVFRSYQPPPASRSHTQIPPIDTRNASPQPPDVSFYSATPASPNTGRARPRAADLKASLEIAKENYKKEKERYRREREERRRIRLAREAFEYRANVQGRSAHSATISPTTPAIPTEPTPTKPSPATSARPQIISNARGVFPQMEIVELPSPRKSPRHHTSASGTGQVRSAVTMSQAMRNVVERLENMGFSEEAYPSINSAIDARLPIEPQITKDKENDVVSEVIEDLLADKRGAITLPDPPRASGSGSRHGDFWL